MTPRRINKLAVDSAGHLSPQKRTHALCLASAQVVCVSFILNVSRIGFPQKWTEKNQIIWWACIGRHSNVKSANKPIPTYSKSDQLSTSSLRYNNHRIVNTSWSWNHCLLKRTLHVLFMFLDSHHRKNNSIWEEDMKVKLESTISQYQDVTQ